MRQLQRIASLERLSLPPDEVLQELQNLIKNVEWKGLNWNIGTVWQNQ